MKIEIDIHNRTVPAEAEWIEECIDSIDAVLHKYGIDATISVIQGKSELPMYLWLREAQIAKLIPRY